MDTLSTAGQPASEEARESYGRRGSCVSQGSSRGSTRGSTLLGSLLGSVGSSTRKYSCVRNPSGVAKGDTPSPLVRVKSHTMQFNGPHLMDIRDERLELKHGMHKDYTLRLQNHIKCVLYNPNMKSCLVLHSNGINRYIKNELTDEYPASEETSDIDKLLHAADYGVYVGVCKQKLKLFDRVFKLLHVQETVQRITAAVFNSYTGEVVTACPGHIKTWVFRQGAKSMAPSLTFSHGIFPKEEITVLHLEPVPGNAQRMFAAIQCSVKVFLMVNGKPLEYLKDIHVRPISAVLFFRPLKLLLTASKDGSIKVWNSSRELCATFVGHSGAVTSLLPYPYGPLVISSSLDGTLRLWELHAFDQLQMLNNVLPMQGVCCEPGIYNILSYSSRQIRVWYIIQLYDQAANIGSPALFIQTSTHPLVPLRVLATCEDAAVRMVSPISMDVITTALLPVGKKIISTCYVAREGLLFVLDEHGFLSLFDTRSSPAPLLACSKCLLNLGIYTCLSLYQEAMDDEEIAELLQNDKWLGVTLEARLINHHRMLEKNPLDKLKEGYSLVLAGTNEGYLVVLDSRDAVVKFSAHGHHGEVVAIACNPKAKQLVSAGKGPTVLVWQVSPLSKEVLFLMSSFSLASPPSLLVATRSRLCVARNNPETSSYTLDMFDIDSKETYSSDAEYAHSDRIVGLDVASKLKLFATCSLDCSVRIWTEDNQPLRILLLDCAADGLVFCSLQADIMIAMNSHLYTIANFTYFTESFHKQLVAHTFPPLISETQMEWSTDPASLDAGDKDRLILTDSSIRGDSYSGDLSAEEMAVVEEAARAKESALSLIAEREREIKAISEGSITTSRSMTTLTRREKEIAWKRYYHLIRPMESDPTFLKSLKDSLTLTLGPSSSEETITEQTTKGSKESTQCEGPFQFFPPLAEFDPPYPVAPDGVLPNSVLLQELRKTAADQQRALHWKPPTLSTKQLDLMEEMLEVSVEEEEEGDSDLMNRLQAAMAAETASSVHSPTPPPTPSPPPVVRKTIVPSKPIQKLIAPKQEKKKVASLSPKVSPPPPKTPTPPPSPVPALPDYITQFVGEYWFQMLFPDLKTLSLALPKPWSVTSFISILLGKMAHPLVGYDIKADICRVILQLLKYHVAHNIDDIYTSVLSLLRGPPILSTTVRHERMVVVHGLRLLFGLKKALDYELAVLLMVHCVEGDKELKPLIMENLIESGLRDPLGYFNAQIEKIGRGKKKDEAPPTATPSFTKIKGDLGIGAKKGEEPSLSPILNTDVIYSKSDQWLLHWTQEYHNATSSNKSLHSVKPSKKSLKDPSKESSISGFGGAAKVSLRRSSSQVLVHKHKPIDVINYFVSIRHQQELAKQRKATPSPKPPQEPEEELKRNAIISLPKMSNPQMLRRLGETHCSCCHPERETSLVLLHRHLPSQYNRPHPSDPSRLWRNFTCFLSLALKRQNINPFLTEEEREEELAAALELQKARFSIAGMVKYFVHEKSYVRTWPEQ